MNPGRRINRNFSIISGSCRGVNCRDRDRGRPAPFFKYDPCHVFSLILVSAAPPGLSRVPDNAASAADSPCYFLNVKL